MRIFSEKTGKEYQTVEACMKAEKEFDEAKAAEEAKKKALNATRAERAKEIDEAGKHYIELVEAFVRDFKTYHFSISDNDFTPLTALLKAFL